MSIHRTLNQKAPDQQSFSQYTTISYHLRFLGIGHFFHHYLLAILPVVALILQDTWSLTTGETVALGTPMFIFLALATLPSGWLGDNWPRQRLIYICYIGSGLAGIFAGFSTGPLTLTIALAMLGTFSAIYHPVGLAMVADYAKRTGPAYAKNGIWGNLGNGGAAILTAAISSYLNWRAAFIIPSFIMLSLGLRYAWLNWQSGNAMLPKQSQQTDHPGVRHTDSEQTSQSANEQSTSVSGLLFFLFSVSVYYGLVTGAITYTLPRFIEEYGMIGDNLFIIGGSTSLILIIGSMAQLGGGWYVERYGARIMLFILFVGQILALMAAAVTTGPLFFLFMALFYSLLYAWFPLTAWLIGRHLPVRSRARVLSLEYVAGLSTTAIAVPSVAWLYDHGVVSHQSLWIVACVATLVLISIAFLPRNAQ